MFFIISKLGAFLITPFTWFFILLVWALLTKNPKRRRNLLIINVCIFYFFSNSFIIDEFMRGWETPAVHDSDLPGTYDVGIVLGGMIAYDPTYDRPQFNRAGDRLFQAVSLYKSGKIKKILITGGSGSIIEDKVLEGPILHNYLIKLGIPDSVVAIESASKNTRENALFCKPKLDSLSQRDPFGKKRYLLITSGMHEPRSVRCFNKVGIAVTPYSTDRYAGPRKYVFDHLFLPNVDAIHAWDALLHEWFGFISYKIAGYI